MTVSAEPANSEGHLQGGYSLDVPRIRYLRSCYLERSETPASTLYSGITKEIATKGKNPVFRKPTGVERLFGAPQYALAGQWFSSNTHIQLTASALHPGC